MPVNIHFYLFDINSYSCLNGVSLPASSTTFFCITARQGTSLVLPFFWSMKLLPYMEKKSMKMWSFLSSLVGFRSMITSSCFSSAGYSPDLFFAFCRLSINSSAFWVLSFPSKISFVICILPLSYSSSPRFTVNFD